MGRSKTPSKRRKLEKYPQRNIKNSENKSRNRTWPTYSIPQTVARRGFVWNSCVSWCVHRSVCVKMKSSRCFRFPMFYWEFFSVLVRICACITLLSVASVNYARISIENLEIFWSVLWITGHISCWAFKATDDGTSGVANDVTISTILLCTLTMLPLTIKNAE